MAKVFMKGNPKAATLGKTRGMKINHRTRMLEAIRHATNAQISGTEKEALFPQREIEELKRKLE